MAAPTKRLDNAKRALKEVFGHADYRPFQAQVIPELLAGNDVFAVEATGGGKALCFQLPALVLPGVTVVVSPLIALMKDQTDKLAKLGVDVCRLTGDLDQDDVAEAMEDLSRYDIIYTSPEKARTAEFAKALMGVRVGMFALDEAHVASRASDYRPDYAHLGGLLEKHDEAVRFACTATADEFVERDIYRLFKLRNPRRIVSSPWRDNIEWRIDENADLGTLEKLLRAAQKRGGSQIIYTASRKEAERLEDELQHLNVVAYHAGMLAAKRTAIQERFMIGDIPCVAATSAFGMGVDKPDIRLVANWQVPASLFDLLQQTGRASRDGKDAIGWLNIGEKSERTQRFFIEMSNPPTYVYEKLWRSFNKFSEPVKWSDDALMRIAGVEGGTFSGWANAALAFLEYTGHISTTPAGLSYRLPINNRASAIRRLKAIPGSRIDDKTDEVVYDTTDPNGGRVSEWTSDSTCATAPPSEMTVVSVIKGKLEIGDDEVADKRQRAEDQFYAIRRFANVEDKRAFVEALFAKKALQT